MVKSFGIFEGGGAKGLAHIGALKITEEKKIEFIGIAGTSAGAIVASLVAAGYTADELYDPTINEGILATNFIELLGPGKWKILSFVKNLSAYWKRYKILRVLAILFLLIIVFVLFLLFVFYVPKIIAAIIVFGGFIAILMINKFLSKFGIFSTKNFEEWLNKELRNKLFPNTDSKIITFSDIETPLAIIATDLASRKIKVFDKKAYPNMSIAEAVAASISIPIVFKPKIFGQEILVDGGVLSNFPAWVFDEEREKEEGSTPTFGFILNNAYSKTETSLQNNNNDNYYEWKTLIGYFNAFAQTVLFGDSVLEVREIEDLHLIPIKVTTNTLDFDLDPGKRLDLYNAGKVGASDFFKTYIGLRDFEEIELLLEFLHQKLAELLGNPDIHIRINIALPVEPKRRKLRILYSHNMGNDTDDKLELGIDSGAIGKCWREKRLVLVDMDDARRTYKTKWKLSKYEQALVRKSLKTLITIPLFEKNLDNTSLSEQNEALAVLSIDSDENLLEELKVLGDRIENDEIERLIKRISKRIVDALRR